MEVSVDKGRLDVALAAVKPFAATRDHLPICRSVLLTAVGDETLQLQTTDLERVITTQVGCLVEQPGSIAVNLGKFKEFVKTLGSGKLVLKQENDEGDTPVLGIHSGDTIATMTGQKGEDFPPAMSLKNVTTWTSFDPDDLVTAIKRVSFVAARDDFRPVLSGINIRVGPEGYELAAADGFRLAIQTVSYTHLTLPTTPYV